MNYLVILTVLSSWTTFRADSARTGFTAGMSNFFASAPAVLSGWIVYNDANGIYSAPVLYDQDGDGKQDIYIGSYGNYMGYPALSLYRAPNASLVWSTPDAGDVYFSVPALMMINYDPYPEAFVGFTGSGGLRCYNGSDGSRIWWAPVGEITYSSPLCFCDPFGNLRAAVVNDLGVLYYIDATTGAVLWTYSGSGSSYSSPALGDPDADGDPEIVFTTSSHIYVMELSGALEWELAYGTILTTPSLADMDAAAGDEIVLYDAGAGNLVVFKSGTPTPVWTYFVGATGVSELPQSPAVGDVNADGTPDVVIHCGNLVSCVEAGALLWSRSTSSPYHRLYGSPLLADLDGRSVEDNGALEVVLTGEDMSTGIGIVYYLQDDGSVAWTWSNITYTHYPIYNDAALGDADGDGLLEIVLVDQCCWAVILKGTDPLATTEAGSGIVGTEVFPTARGLVFELVGAGPVSANFYDPAGRLAWRFRGDLPAGRSRIEPEATGILFYSATVGQEKFRGKLVLAR